MTLRPGQRLTVGLGVTADAPEELDEASATVWTNYGSGDSHAAPPRQANRLVFRVSDPEVDRLLVRQVPLDKANARSDSTEISTIEDMLETDETKYNLTRLAAAGVNCVWVQVPYRLDYAQVAVDAAQLAQVAARLASRDIDESLKDYAEYMLPQLYAAKYPDGTYNPFGAASVYDTYSPDWYGLWADTKHLNHGGHAGQHVWYPRTEQNLHVLAWVGRAMLWAASDLGVDGFRVDHALGMPYFFFEHTLPWVEMKMREKRGNDAALLLVVEDHDRKRYSASVGDVVQFNEYESLLHRLNGRDVEGVWAYYDDPDHTLEFTGHGNHDEVRGSTFFGDDLLAYGNAVLTMMLMGGAMSMLAGDEFAEAQQLRFKAKGGIPTLWQLRLKQLPQANRELGSWVSRCGFLRTTHPALAGTHRERLHLRDSGHLKDSGPRPSIMACARSTPGAGVPLMIFNNLDHVEWVTARYDVGAGLGSWLSEAPGDFYQVRDLMGLDPQRSLWSRAIEGRTILDDGLDVGLQPYQIQALELHRVA